MYAETHAPRQIATISNISMVSLRPGSHWVRRAFNAQIQSSHNAKIGSTSIRTFACMCHTEMDAAAHNTTQVAVSVNFTSVIVRGVDSVTLAANALLCHTTPTSSV